MHFNINAIGAYSRKTRCKRLEADLGLDEAGRHGGSGHRAGLEVSQQSSTAEIGAESSTSGACRSGFFCARGFLRWIRPIRLRAGVQGAKIIIAHVRSDANCAGQVQHANPKPASKDSLQNPQ